MIFNAYNIDNETKNYSFSLKKRKGLNGSILPNDYCANYYLYDVHRVALMHQGKEKIFWKSLVLLVSAIGDDDNQKIGYAFFEEEDESNDFFLITRMAYNKKHDLEILRHQKVVSPNVVLKYPTLDLHVRLLSRKDCAVLVKEYDEISKSFEMGVKFISVENNSKKNRYNRFQIFILKKEEPAVLEASWHPYLTKCSLKIERTIEKFEKTLSLDAKADIQEITFIYRSDAEHFEELKFAKILPVRRS